MECSCLEDDCDFAMGCENNDSGIRFYLISKVEHSYYYMY